jgi:E3 ubiquitin-protein ligase RNF38/44
VCVCEGLEASLAGMEPARRLLLSDYAGAIESPLPSPPPATPFRPGVAVVVGILTSVFSITFLLLLYAKHCKRSAAEPSSGGGRGAAAGGRRNSGVDRAVVESLPVFRFAALRGRKAEGLECAVCLGRFEPAEALRLLPKCRHGFHVECVDTWLDAHSTCPLCRSRVDPEDVLLLPEPPKPSTTGPPDPPDINKPAAAPATEEPVSRQGGRISGRHSTGSVRGAPGYKVSRHSVDGGVSVGCFDGAKVRKDRVLLAAAVAEPDPEAFDRRFGHRILVSGREDETKQRWSDLVFVRSEMLVTDAGARYSCSAAVNSGNKRSVISSVRSLSELAGVSRLPPIRAGDEPRTSSGAARRWPGSGWWAPAPGGNGPST